MCLILSDGHTDWITISLYQEPDSYLITSFEINSGSAAKTCWVSKSVTCAVRTISCKQRKKQNLVCFIWHKVSGSNLKSNRNLTNLQMTKYCKKELKLQRHQRNKHNNVYSQSNFNWAKKKATQKFRGEWNQQEPPDLVYFDMLNVIYFVWNLIVLYQLLVLYFLK